MLHALGGEAEVNREVASLRFSLRSLATARPGSRAADAMADVCATVAARLDALLLAPLERAPATGRSCSCRPASCTRCRGRCSPRSRTGRSPSRRRCGSGTAPRSTRPATTAPAVLVAGPRLPAATEEIETLRARHPEALALTARRTPRSPRSTHALDGADSAHLAAHGRFRDDNPLFCSLELADGALTVYDLERLRRAPRRLVLSSCESGLSAVHAGDELMGFTAAVFALGTATVIAAVVPVPDEATAGLMLALDDELRRRRRAGRGARQRARRDRRRRPPPHGRARGLRLFRRGLTTLDQVKTKPLRSTIELVLIVAAALFFALDPAGAGGQAVPDPVGLDAADAQARPADPRRPLLAPPRRRPGARRRHRLPSAARRGHRRLRAPRRGPVLLGRPGDAPLVLAADRDPVGRRRSSSASSGCRATRSRSSTAT